VQLSPVSNSVMPKGVEHRSAVRRSSSPSVVSNSVMPKGVEHCFQVLPEAMKQIGVEFSDAERR
jgi:hypothetical protein